MVDLLKHHMDHGSHLLKLLPWHTRDQVSYSLEGPPPCRTVDLTLFHQSLVLLDPSRPHQLIDLFLLSETLSSTNSHSTNPHLSHIFAQMPPSQWGYPVFLGLLSLVPSHLSPLNIQYNSLIMLIALSLFFFLPPCNYLSAPQTANFCPLIASKDLE